jgi:hypothetical protein
MIRTVDQTIAERHLEAERRRELAGARRDRSTFTTLKGFVKRGHN